MPLHIGVYLKNTRRLTTEQHGAYLLLIMEYWQQQEPLPDDDDDLASVTGLVTERWTEIRPKLERYFVIENGVWRHERIDREIEEANTKLKEKAERMQRVREARASKQSAAKPAKGSITKTDTSSVTSPVTEAVTETVAGSTTHLPSPSPSPSINNPPIVPPSGGNATGEEKPKRKRRSRLPDDFPSQADLETAQAYWSEHSRSDINPRRQVEKFRAHHEGKGTLAASWPATWRTWYVNAVEFQKPNQNKPPGSSSDMSRWGRNNQQSNLSLGDHD